MRNLHYQNKTIEALLPGVRKDILSILLINPERWWYMSDLANHLNRQISSLQRELKSLHEAGILESRREGNRVYYRADVACPIFSELRSIITKTSGLIDQIREVLLPYENEIQLAFVFGSIARFDDSSTSDVDLFIIGSVGLSDLSPALRDVEEQISREINPYISSAREFRVRYDEGNHFIRSILDAEHLFIIGNADELERLLNQ
jgi:predicted nucleotidyltransferase